MKLEEQDFFVESTDPNIVKFKEPIKVFDKRAEQVDCNLFLCAIRIRQCSSKFLSHSFPSPSSDPTLADMKTYLNDNVFCPPWRTLFDFNFLYFLAFTQYIKLEDLIHSIDLILGKENIPYFQSLMNRK